MPLKVTSPSSGPLKPGQSCTLAVQINDLDALREHLGFAKIDLLGHSWGRISRD
jgi:pimeloyl-ACP methyl ester carboxylesterase